MKKQTFKIHKINDKEVIDGRELYSILNIGRDFPTWIRSKVKAAGLIEGKDFVINKRQNDKVRHSLDYSIEIGAAIKMLETMRVTNNTIKVINQLNSIYSKQEKDFKFTDTIKEHNNVHVVKMNPILIEENNYFGQVRFTIINDREYAVAKDIAVALGYSNTSQAIRTHCKGVLETSVPTRGGKQIMKVISEGDIYRLIAGSKLPAAEKFESWIFDEVLPSIRKHGLYASENTIDKMLNDPDYAIKLLENYKKEKEQKEALLKEHKKNQPKIMAYNEFIDSDGLYTFSTAAKILAIPRTATSNIIIGRNTLLAWLRRDGILISEGEERNIPYQRYFKQGLFRLQPVDGEEIKNNRLSVRITPKGIEWLYKKYRYSNMPKKIDIDKIVASNDVEYLNIAM